jgi:hypothetical protein
VNRRSPIRDDESETVLQVAQLCLPQQPLRVERPVVQDQPLSHLLREPRLDEPPHVHVDRDDQSAKFWLAPVALARNLGFTAVELRRVQRLVAVHEPRLLEAWNEYFRGAVG